MSGNDITLLALLGSPADQDDNIMSIPAAIDPIAWTEINLQLGDAANQALNIGPMSRSKPGEGRSDAHCARCVE